MTMPRTQRRSAVLGGYAVLITGANGVPYVEYWKYNPVILTKTQKKKLGIRGWRLLRLLVKENDRG